METGPISFLMKYNEIVFLFLSDAILILLRFFVKDLLLNFIIEIIIVLVVNNVCYLIFIFVFLVVQLSTTFIGTLAWQFHISLVV